MKLNYRKVGIAIAGLALIGDVFMLNLNFRSRQSIAQAKRSRDVAVKVEDRQRSRNRHPVIRKTVPSAYKKMLTDGHYVTNAENKILKMYASGHGKVNKSSSAYQHAKDILNQYTDGGTDNNLINMPWTNNYHATVKMIPGASSMNGNCQGAFIVVNKNGDVTNVFSANYNPHGDMFSDMKIYNIPKAKRNHSTLHISKKAVKRHPKQLRGKKQSTKNTKKQPVRKQKRTARRK